MISYTVTSNDTQLLLATFNNNIEIVRSLLNHNASVDINVSNKHNITPLFISCGYSNSNNYNNNTNNNNTNNNNSITITPTILIPILITTIPILIPILIPTISIPILIPILI